MSKAYLFGGNIPDDKRIQEIEDKTSELVVSGYRFHRKPTLLIIEDAVKFECDSDAEDEECWNCNGKKTIECGHCDGEGTVECDECDENGRIKPEDNLND